jgi:RimJ/RimL family protein N-acetyltransferase
MVLAGMSALVLETPRLVLSPLLPADAPRLLAYRSDPAVSRYQSWVPASEPDVLRFIQDQQALAFDTPGTWFQLGIRVRDSSILAGDAGVHFPGDQPHQAELGVTVAPNHQGQGFATETLTALLDHLFGPAAKHRVFASVDPRNGPSLALLERVGLRKEAHFRESLWLEGEWVDDMVYAVLRSEWLGRPRDGR